MINLEDFLDGAFILGAAASVIALAFAVAGYFSLPTVQISHSTGECVQVIPNGSCDNLPPKYAREVVK